MNDQLISKKMSIKDIVLQFPPKAQKLRRVILNYTEYSEELPTEPLQDYLFKYKKNENEIETFVKKLNWILEEKTDLSSLSLTKKVAIKLKELFHQKGERDWGLRYADQPAHCGTGYEYILEVAPVSGSQEDCIFISHGVKISTPVSSLKRLQGSLIDYEEGYFDDHLNGLLKIGFVIINPNVKRTCPCACSNGYDL